MKWQKLIILGFMMVMLVKIVQGNEITMNGRATKLKWEVSYSTDEDYEVYISDEKTTTPTICLLHKTETNPFNLPEKKEIYNKDRNKSIGK